MLENQVKAKEDQELTIKAALEQIIKKIHKLETNHLEHLLKSDNKAANDQNPAEDADKLNDASIEALEAALKKLDPDKAGENANIHKEIKEQEEIIKNARVDGISQDVTGLILKAEKKIQELNKQIEVKKNNILNIIKNKKSVLTNEAEQLEQLANTAADTLEKVKLALQSNHVVFNDKNTIDNGTDEYKKPKIELGNKTNTVAVEQFKVSVEKYVLKVDTAKDQLFNLLNKEIADRKTTIVKLFEDAKNSTSIAGLEKLKNETIKKLQGERVTDIAALKHLDNKEIDNEFKDEYLELDKLINTRNKELDELKKKIEQKNQEIGTALTSGDGNKLSSQEIIELPNKVKDLIANRDKLIEEARKYALQNKGDEYVQRLEGLNKHVVDMKAVIKSVKDIETQITQEFKGDVFPAEITSKALEEIKKQIEILIQQRTQQLKEVNKFCNNPEFTDFSTELNNLDKHIEQRILTEKIEEDKVKIDELFKLVKNVFNIETLKDKLSKIQALTEKRSKDITNAKVLESNKYDADDNFADRVKELKELIVSLDLKATNLETQIKEAEQKIIEAFVRSNENIELSAQEMRELPGKIEQLIITRDELIKRQKVYNSQYKDGDKHDVKLQDLKSRVEEMEKAIALRKQIDDALVLKLAEGKEAEKTIAQLEALLSEINKDDGLSKQWKDANDIVLNHCKEDGAECSVEIKQLGERIKKNKDLMGILTPVDNNLNEILKNHLDHVRYLGEKGTNDANPVDKDTHDDLSISKLNEIIEWMVEQDYITKTKAEIAGIVQHKNKLRQSITKDVATMLATLEKNANEVIKKTETKFTQLKTAVEKLLSDIKSGVDEIKNGLLKPDPDEKKKANYRIN